MKSKLVVVLALIGFASTVFANPKQTMRPMNKEVNEKVAKDLAGKSEKEVKEATERIMSTIETGVAGGKEEISKALDRVFEGQPDKVIKKLTFLSHINEGRTAFAKGTREYALATSLNVIAARLTSIPSENASLIKTIEHMLRNVAEVGIEASAVEKLSSQVISMALNLKRLGNTAAQSEYTKVLEIAMANTMLDKPGYESFQAGLKELAGKNGWNIIETLENYKGDLAALKKAIEKEMADFLVACK